MASSVMKNLLSFVIPRPYDRGICFLFTLAEITSRFLATLGMTKQPLFQRPAKRRQIAENGRGIAPTLLEFEKADDEPGPSESSGQEGQKMRVPRCWRGKLRLPAVGRHLFRTRDFGRWDKTGSSPLPQASRSSGEESADSSSVFHSLLPACGIA